MPITPAPPPRDPVAATPGLRSLGTGARQACAGDDSRLSDARTPTAHAASHASGGGDALTLAQSQVTGLVDALAGKADATHTHATSDVTGLDSALSALASAYAPPVADLAALRAVAEADRADKQLRLVESAGAVYRFDAEGAGDDDGDGTIAPTVGTGRWFKTAAATQAHGQLTGLQGGTSGERYHLTAAEYAALGTGTPIGSASGDLGGTYPAPTVDRVTRHQVAVQSVAMAAASEQLPRAPTVRIVSVPGDSPVSLTAAPLLPAGSDGERVRLENLTAKTLRVASSGGGLLLDYDFDFAPYAAVELEYSSGSGGWLPLASDAASLQLRPVAATAPTSGQVLAWNGSAWAPAAASGGGSDYSSAMSALAVEGWVDVTHASDADGARRVRAVGIGAMPLVPTMSSNTGQGYTVSASSEYSDGNLHPAWAVFTPNDAGTAGFSQWTSSVADGPTAWVQVQLPSAAVATSYVVGTSSNQDPSQAPRAWSFQASNDGNNWTTLDTRSSQSWDVSQTRTFTLANVTAYSYYRLDVTEVNGNVVVSLGTLQVYSSVNGPIVASVGDLGSSVPHLRAYFLDATTTRLINRTGAAVTGTAYVTV